KSTEHQIGAFVIVLDGHVRSLRSSGGYGVYLAAAADMLCMPVSGIIVLIISSCALSSFDARIASA
ncbi:MAG: hypothetical protein U5K75_04060, partial [Ahrensia sp.]|nr:hypothetical protein [Ahrensia sp.]